MLEEIKKERLRKLENFKEKGIDPYPSGPFRKDDLTEVLKKKVGEESRIAGRIVLFRNMGNITFAQLADESGRGQIVINKKEFDGDYKLWTKNLDIGDFVGVEGERFDTQKGEKSVLVKKLTLLCKSIRPLPDKHKALKNEDARLRKRYLDIIFNPEVKELIYKKSVFWKSVREYMQKEGFLEVETPVLEVTAGGADAQPFVTHHNALDLDVFLRISMGELWQKRLMVAGLEKTFEIGRQFRNEGMDAEHLQDYTQMEFYLAYADFNLGMRFVEKLYRHVIEKTFGTLKFEIGKHKIDFADEWVRYDYVETIKEKTGIDIGVAKLDEIEKKLQELGVEYDKKGFNITRAIDNLWKFCRKDISGPGFLVGLPVVMAPLAKRDPFNKEMTQRFHPLFAGTEMGTGYSELNDPIDQAQRFERQQKLRDEGDDEAQMHDADFVEALEYGMPPTFGFGMSERVFSVLAGKTARECQIFPLMKPRNK